MDAHPTGTAAVSWANGRIDTFWVDAGRSLIHRAFVDGAWLEPESLGGALASAPAATAWAVDQLQVFAIFDDGELWNRYWDGTSWHPWESLGGELTGSPAASSWGADRIDVFAPAATGCSGIAGGTAPAGSSGSGFRDEPARCLAVALDAGDGPRQPIDPGPDIGERRASRRSRHSSAAEFYELTVGRAGWRSPVSPIPSIRPISPRNPPGPSSSG